MIVTPDLAGAWLATSRQKRIDPERVARFAGRMRRGEWRNDAEARPVIIRDGWLRNGNHRLRAVVAAGVAVELIVQVESSNG